MPDRRHLRLLVTTTMAIAAVGGGIAASPAAAVSSTGRILPADIDKLPRGGAIEYGNATVKLSSKAAGRLKSAGTTLKATGDATIKPKLWEFEAVEDSGPLDVTQMVGAAGASGGFTAKGKKGTVKVSAIVFQPGGTNKNVVAKIGGKLVELGTLKGGKASFSRRADGLLRNAKLSLTAKGAKALNAKTGGGFAAGAFGTVQLKFTTRELPLKEGVAKLTLAPGLLDTLTANGLTITTTPPASREGNVVSIQLTAGAFDPENVTGRLQLEGKVTVGKPGTSVDLFGWRGVVNAKQKELFGNVNENVAAVVADVDVTDFTARFEGSQFIATGAKLKLSGIAANTIKQQFGTVVAAGTEMGTVEITGSLSGK